MATRALAAAIAPLLLLCVVACSVPAARQATARPMRVRDVKFDPATQSPVLWLTERGGQERELLIWIGRAEADSIAVALKEFELPRPNAHDLVKSMLHGIEGRVERVVVTELRNSTYYAEIELDVGGRKVAIDARPSDAIAIAVRTKTPIYAAEPLLDVPNVSSEGDAGGGEDWPPADARDL